MITTPVISYAEPSATATWRD